MTPATPTISAHGVTWNLIGSLPWNSPANDRLTAWWGIVPAGTSGSVIFTPGESTTGAVWSVFAYTGHDPAAPVSAGVTMADSDTAWGPLSTGALTGQLTVWGASRVSTDTTGSVFTGATQIHSVTHAAPNRHLITFEKAAENSPGITWSPVAAVQSGGIAFKIREPSAAVPQPDVVVAGVKKPVVAQSVIVSSVKKAVVNKWVVVAGSKRPVV